MVDVSERAEEARDHRLPANPDGLLEFVRNRIRAEGQDVTDQRR